MIGTNGLVEVSDDDLRLLLRHVYRGELLCPITPQGLACIGRQGLNERLGILKGLDESSVRAVLVAVIAERRAR